MGEFDYQMPTMALPQRKIDIEKIFSTITKMEDEDANFIGSIYGPAGGGKTIAAIRLAIGITDPDLHILYNFTGQNWNSLKNHPELLSHPRLIKRPFENMDDLRALVAALRTPNVRNAAKIGCVIFDEYNTMFDMEVNQITNVRAAQLIQEKGQKAYKDPDTPEWPDYNTAKAHMITMMNDVMTLKDMHFIFVCHPRQQSKTFVTEPDFFPKAAQEFIRALNSIYYLAEENNNGKIERKITLKGDDRLVAKNRIGGLPRTVNTIEQVIEAYKVWGPAAKEAEAPKEPEVSVTLTNSTTPQETKQENTVETGGPQGDAEASPVSTVVIANELPSASKEEVAFDLDDFLKI